MPLEIRICYNEQLEFAECHDEQVRHQLQADNPHLNGQALPPGTAYLRRPDYSVPYFDPVPANQQQVVNQLQLLSMEEKKRIGELNNLLGSEAMLAMAEFYQEQLQPILASEATGVSGAAATAIETRSGKFVQAATKYQNALLRVREAAKSGLPRHQVHALEQVAKQHFTYMNEKFRAELERYMKVQQASPRGTIWSNPQRAIHLAHSARTDKPIRLATSAQFNKIRLFEQSARVAGKTLIGLDAFQRGRAVYQDYQRGNDWHRRLATELTGFGLGTAAGLGIGFTLTTQLTLMLALTPAGWIAVLIIGVAAGYFAAKVMDGIGKDFAGYIYDSSMQRR